MVVVQGSKLTLPNPCSCILFESTSHSLALTHSDSSISLFPSFSLPFNSLPSPQTLIPSPSSSSTFLLLQSSNPNPTLLFLVSSPHRAGSQILLRFYILHRNTNSFVPLPRVVSSHKDLRFVPNLGVLLDLKHGVLVRLSGSVNYFALYSVSNSKVWVFGVKEHDDDDDAGGCCVKLMRCAVIDCEKPVWSVSISFGFLLLGEENGVRVFGLRRLVKGWVGKRVGALNSSSKQVRNGRSGEGVLEMMKCNGELEGRIEKHGVAVKQTNVKFKHDNMDGGSCFVPLKGNEIETKSMTKVSMSIKAISIQAVSQRMFLILDSFGDLHVLHLSNSGIGVDITGHVRQLPHIMKVKSLAVLPDVSTMSQTIWISDGCHSVHMFSTMDMENALIEADGNDSDEKPMHLPVIRVLFSSEKIQDIISLPSNSVLFLGQGSLYAYAIS